MTYTSITTKEGVIGDLGLIYLDLRCNDSNWVLIYITKEQYTELRALRDSDYDAEIKCEIQQVRDVGNGNVKRSNLISFTVKTNQSFTDALKTI